MVLIVNTDELALSKRKNHVVFEKIILARGFRQSGRHIGVIHKCLLIFLRKRLQPDQFLQVVEDSI